MAPCKFVCINAHLKHLELTTSENFQFLPREYILTAVCPFSNFLISVAVPAKTATTAAIILPNHVFHKFGFPEIIQSDHGTEFLNAIRFRITKMLSIKYVFTTSYRPRMKGSTEKVHRFLNTALGIFCEKHHNITGNHIYRQLHIRITHSLFLMLPIRIISFLILGGMPHHQK